MDTPPPTERLPTPVSASRPRQRGTWAGRGPQILCAQAARPEHGARMAQGRAGAAVVRSAASTKSGTSGSPRSMATAPKDQ